MSDTRASDQRLVEFIRSAYEVVIESQWFQDVYAGKSLGESIRIEIGETYNDGE